MMDNRRLDTRHTFDSVIAASSAMRQVIATARKLALESRYILLEGDVGTGRKFLAKVIHHESTRGAHPIVTLRCEALTVNVLDKTLFGDPCTGTMGKFEESADGTLLLTDLEDLSPVAQERLLKVLEEGRFTTSDYETRIITSRLISTADRAEIEKQIRSGQFSGELFAKLSEASLRLPSLSERHQDIPDLVVTVLRELAERERIETPPVPFHYMELLMSVTWPENVRQLRNHIESVMVLSGGQFDPEIIREHFVPEGTPATIKGAFQTVLNKVRGSAEPELAVNRVRK